jgi:phosphatidylglycerophosphate synthase
VLTVLGATRLNTASGFWLATVGKLLDVVDGPVARRTHTSQFGALLDGGADKLTGAALIISELYLGLAPPAFLFFLLFYHALIALMAADAVRKGIETKPTCLGKYTMFLQVSALLLFALAHLAVSVQPQVHATALVIALAGVVAGVVSLVRYIRGYLDVARRRTHK